MFRPSRGSDQSKIRLPRQTVAPGVKELTSLYEQARENRAREVELVWQVPQSSMSYSIHVKFDRVTPHPIWNIWENNGRESKMVWRFETSDVHMIYDVVAMLDVAHQKTTGTVQTVNSSGGFNPVASGQFGTRQGMPAMSPPGTSISGNSTTSGSFSTSQRPAQNPGQLSGQSFPQQPIQGGFNQPAAAINDGWRPADPVATPQNNSFQNNQLQNSGGFQAPQTGNFQSPPTGTFQNQQQGSFQSPQAAAFQQQSQTGMQSTGMAQAIQQAQAANPNAGNFPQPGQTQNPGFNPAQRPTPPVSPSGSQSMPEGTLPADFFSEAPATIAAAPVKTNSIEGTIEQNPMNNVLTTIGMQQVTGKLEVVGPAAVGHVYFENGIPKDAQTSNNRGDEAIKELVTWRSGSFLFKPGVRTEMQSVEKSLQSSVMEGIALLDQLKHLEKAGLVYESTIIQKQKNLGEPELKLMLSKGVPLDFNTQKEVYESLKHKTTFTDLLRDRPMEQTQWAPLLFNLLYCGLIEIRPPAAARGGALDFLGESKSIIQNLAYNFIRTDTGLMSCEALLYFMEYEYYRYEAYSWPMSLVVFELMLKRTGGSGIIEKDPLPVQALQTAAMRIGLVKRPLDTMAHFYGQDFAIMMPNTKASQAAFVANRVLDALTVTPLAPGIDKANLSLAFGVANLPSDGEDLESLIQAAVDAHDEAKKGTFPIVLARTSKRD
ncbi:MAG: DUF4388 domain-containing protein [Candidatus Melainabacteria bacterium]|nr:DUF4388 domain-containing protein [Candidatus Melainabacteria bacterium]